MKTKLSMTVIAGLLIFLSANVSFAQDSDMKGMMDKPEMSAMMKSPHHKLMMAYRHNLLTFATTLRDLANDPENFDDASAKVMFSEIDRSFEQMNLIHMSHMGKMDPAMKEKMAPMMEKKKLENAELARNIAALKQNIQSDSIDKKQAGENSAAIVGILGKMGDHDKKNMKNK